MADDNEGIVEGNDWDLPISTSDRDEKKVVEEHIAELPFEDVRTENSTSKASGRVKDWVLRQIDLLRRPPYSRHIYSVGLLLSWIIGFAFIIAGAVTQSIANTLDNFDDVYHSQGTVITGRFIFVALIHGLTTIIVTVTVELAGLLHSASLRSMLLKEDRLQYNSNSRLFTSNWEQLRSGVDYSVICGYSLIFLGIGLLFQTCIGTLAWMKSEVLTRSTNPLHVAAVYKAHHRLSRSTKMTMLGVHKRKQHLLLERPVIAKPRQASLLTSDRAIKKILVFLWLTTGIVSICSITAATAIVRASESITDHGVRLPWGSLADWSWVINRNTPAIAFPIRAQRWSPIFIEWFKFSYLLVGSVMSIFTLALHLAELVAQASRDEVLWRRSGASCGVRLGYHESFLVQIISWQTIVLFGLKCLIHWFVGLSFQTCGGGLMINVPQLCYTSIAMIVLTVMSTILACYQPRGPQPATYGHLQTLVDLVDEWPYKESASGDEERGEDNDRVPELDGKKKLYWGDKGENADHTRRAGTAFEPLLPIHMNRLYY